MKTREQKLFRTGLDLHEEDYATRSVLNSGECEDSEFEILCINNLANGIVDVTGEEFCALNIGWTLALTVSFEI